jgi:hypothetical protein
MAEQIKWEDPRTDAVVPGQRRKRWDEIAAQLRDQPGKWALVQTCRSVQAAAGLASTIIRAKDARWGDPGDFGARYSETTGEVWACFGPEL